MNNLGCRIVVSLGARRFASISSPKAAAKPFFTRKALYATALTGCAGGLGYYLLQDTVYLEEAHGAHEHVPPLALHPQTGGPKNLPIVTHQLDEEKGEEQKPRLVILGGGWGAVSMLQHLDRGKYNVTVISDNNYFLFTPLLPSVTVGTNEARSLLEPIRKIAARVRGHFLEAKAVDIDLDQKMVEVKSANGDEHFYVPYDKLVVAVGATSITHGIEGIENTLQLKTIHDALAVRRKIMINVEQACLPTTTPEERKRLLSFVVCGGGPTGTEYAAELFDWINEDLVKWFPKLLREDITVSIIQSRDHILNTFDSSISEYAEKRFAREHINVITNARVVRIDPDKVVYRLKDKSPDDPSGYKVIPQGLCLWSTGIAMTPFVRNISKKLGEQIHKRALVTDAFLRVKGIDDGSAFALGDCATVENPKLLEHIMEIFETVDKDKDGKLSQQEFKEAIEYMRSHFPLADQHLQKLDSMFDKYDADKNGNIDFDEMKIMLKDLDSKMTQLPATAQRASQQGKYLAKQFNRAADGKENLRPFRYQHLGSLAYVGNTAVGEFSWGYKMIGGLYALYLWRSVYWSEQVSMRTRMNLSIDWTKCALFGRDISTV